MTVEKRKLLPTMYLIIGIIDIQNDHFRGPLIGGYKHIDERQGKPIQLTTMSRYSYRDMVGWLARPSAVTGRRSQAIFIAGSDRRLSQSFASSQPRAI